MLTHLRSANYRYWGLWTGINAISVTLGWLVTSSVARSVAGVMGNVVSLPLIGQCTPGMRIAISLTAGALCGNVLLGLAQWWVLRRWVRRAEWWFVATVIGAVTGFGLAAIRFDQGGWQPLPLLISVVVSGAIYGGITGWALNYLISEGEQSSDDRASSQP